MSQTPLISIITPVHNGEKFIENCIKNVIDQNCTETEHVIVDGGSNDGTTKIIHYYAQNYDHIRWISEPDQGQSDALNKGIALARGDIVGILNVDDYYQPNVLNHIGEIFNTLPVPSFLVGNCNLWDNDERLFHVNKPKSLKFSQLLMGPNIYPFPCNPSAYFYHAAIHNEIGSFDIHDHFTMDLDFILRVAKEINTKYVDETWGNFRVIQGTKTQGSIQRGDNLEIMEKVFEKHRKALPRFQQIITRLFYKLFENQLIAAPLYFYRNPDELSWRLKARIQHVFKPKDNV
jgi:glycosyltransferase involved in cell wall biosynthesis